jgi:hypothetical protein
MTVAVVERNDPEPVQTSSGEARTKALVETPRTAFVRAGARGSRCEAQDGGGCAHEEE